MQAASVSRQGTRRPHPFDVVLVSLPGLSLWALILFATVRAMQGELYGDGAAGSEWPPLWPLMLVGIPKIIGLSAACGVGVLALNWPWRTRLLACCVNLSAVLVVVVFFFAGELLAAT